MPPTDWLAAIPADDVRYPIARTLADYWERRRSGWTPAELVPAPCAFGLRRDSEQMRS